MNNEFLQQSLGNQEAIILLLQKRLNTVLGTGNTMPPEYAVIVSKVLLSAIEGYAYLKLKQSGEIEQQSLTTNGDELENIIR